MLIRSLQIVTCSNFLEFFNELLAFAPDCTALRAKLKDRLPWLTDPPVQNVEMIEYAVLGKAGFVLCYVPRSSFKPHRAETRKRFYIRITDDFKEPSVTWLRRMFTPEVGPDFKLFVEIHPKAVVAGQQEVLFHIFMVNEGTGTA